MTANNVTVLADNLNFFNASTLGLGVQAGGRFALGATAAVGDFLTHATARIDGNITANGAVIVDAKSINTKNITSASTTTVNKLQDKAQKIGTSALFGPLVQGLQIAKLVQAVISKGSGTSFGAKANKFLNLNPGSPQFSFSASVGIAVTENDAIAAIGDGATVDAGGSVTVNAVMEDNFQANSAGASGEAQNLSIGGAVVISVVDNDADAYIGKGAVVDAVGTIRVTANADMPNQFDLFNLGPFIPDSDDPDTTGLDSIFSKWTDGVTAGEAVGETIPTVILGILATGGQIAGNISTFASSGGTGTGDDSVGLAGALNFVDIFNDARAYIDEGAQINQNVAFPDEVQDVIVEARAKAETVHAVGQASVLGLFGVAPPGSEESFGAGGSILVGLFENGAEAYIADGVSINAANTVSVTADVFDFLVTAAQAGSKSSTLGIQGSVSFFRSEMDALAYIDDEAVIVAGDNVDVAAETTLTAANLTGGIVAGGEFALGVSASIGVIDQVTRAFIGDANDSTSEPGSTPGSVVAGGDVNVTANVDQNMIAFSLSGVSTVGADAPAGAPAPDIAPTDTSGDATNGVDTSQANPDGTNPAGEGEEEKKFGIGIAGDVAFNLIDSDVEAFISDILTMQVGGDVVVDADVRTLMIAAGIGGAIADQAGIGGSFANNNIFANTFAYIEDVDLTIEHDDGTGTGTFVGGDLSITADMDNVVTALSFGAAGALKNAAVAGSANFSLVVTDTQAYLGDGAQVLAVNDVTIDANNRLILPSIAGAVALAIGAGMGTKGVGVGAAVDIIAVDNTTRAYVASTASIDATGDIRIFAHSEEIFTSWWLRWGLGWPWGPVRRGRSG